MGGTQRSGIHIAGIHRLHLYARSQDEFQFLSIVLASTPNLVYQSDELPDMSYWIRATTRLPHPPASNPGSPVTSPAIRSSPCFEMQALEASFEPPKSHLLPCLLILLSIIALLAIIYLANDLPPVIRRCLRFESRSSVIMFSGNFKKASRYHTDDAAVNSCGSNRTALSR